VFITDQRLCRFRQEYDSGFIFSRSHQFIQIVAKRAVGAEGSLVKKSFGPAAQAHLVGISLYRYRPAHMPMPAASESHDDCPRQAVGNRLRSPPPVGLSISFAASLFDCVHHRISKVLVGGRFLQDRTNRDTGQSLNGRRKVTLHRLPPVRARFSPNRTCTDGRCGASQSRLRSKVEWFAETAANAADWTKLPNLLPGCRYHKYRGSAATAQV
jgi:hypothetical protein